MGVDSPHKTAWHFQNIPKARLPLGASGSQSALYELIKSTAKQLLTDDKVAVVGASGQPRPMSTAFSAQYQNWPVDATFHDELLEWHDASDQFDAAYVQRPYGRGFGKRKGKGRGGDKIKGKPRSGPGQSSSRSAGRDALADGSGCLLCSGLHWAFSCPVYACDQPLCNSQLMPGQHHPTCCCHLNNCERHCAAGAAYQAELDTGTAGYPVDQSGADQWPADAQVYVLSQFYCRPYRGDCQVNFADAAGSWAESFDGECTADYDN